MPDNEVLSSFSVRVLICESEPLVMAGLKASVRGSDIEVVGEVDSSRQLLTSVTRNDVDVVLMGTTYPAGGGTDMTRIVKTLKCRIVIMLKASDHDLFLSFLEAGVRGFVSTHTAPADLAEAVRSVARDQAYLSPALTLRLLDWLAEKLVRQTFATDLPTAKLSVRELEVLRLLGNGTSNADISRVLRIQEATVRSHVYHILTKLNLRSRAEAVLYGFQHGLRSAG